MEKSSKARELGSTPNPNKIKSNSSPIFLSSTKCLLVSVHV